MPLAQSVLNTLSTPGGRLTGAAPVTTTSGDAPPDWSSQMPRSTSRTPSTSTSAFGWPSRDPDPAANSTPATVAAWRSVMDPPGGHGQRLARATPTELDQLGGDGHCGLLGRPGPEVQADRGTQPGQFLLGQARLAEPGEPVLVRATAAHGADVGGGSAQRHLE